MFSQSSKPPSILAVSWWWGVRVIKLWLIWMLWYLHHEPYLTLYENWKVPNQVHGLKSIKCSHLNSTEVCSESPSTLGRCHMSCSDMACFCLSFYGSPWLQRCFVLEFLFYSWWWTSFPFPCPNPDRHGESPVGTTLWPHSASQYWEPSEDGQALETFIKTCNPTHTLGKTSGKLCCWRATRV